MDLPDSPPSTGTSSGDRPDEPRSTTRSTTDTKRLPPEFQFVLISLALVMMIALAGVPGGPEKEVGDGTDALQLGWAERHAAAHTDWLPPELPTDSADPDASDTSAGH